MCDIMDFVRKQRIKDQIKFRLGRYQKILLEYYLPCEIIKGDYKKGTRLSIWLNAKGFDSVSDVDRYFNGYGVYLIQSD